MCSTLFVDIRCIVSGYHNTRVAHALYGFLQCKTNGHYFQNVDMKLGLVFRPATMKGQPHRLEMSYPSIMVSIREMECIGIWRIDEHSLNETIGVYPPFKM